MDQSQSDITKEEQFILPDLCRYFQKSPNSIDIVELHRGNRTLVANKQFKEGEILFQISQDYFINNRTPIVNKSPLVIYIHQQILKMRLQRQKNQNIAENNLQLYLRRYNLAELIFLIEKKFMNHAQIKSPNKNIQQVCQSYIQILPKDYSYHPIMNLKDIKTFHPWIYKQLKKTKSLINKVHQQIQKILQNEQFRQFLSQNYPNKNLQRQYTKHFNEDNISWALMVFKTRSFQKHLLVPLLDMINHSSQKRNIRYTFDDCSKIIQAIAVRKIKEKQKLFIQYNNLSMYDYYEIYGFIPEQQKCKFYIQIYQTFWSEQKIIITINTSQKYDKQLKKEIKNIYYKIQKQYINKDYLYFKIVALIIKELHILIKNIKNISEKILNYIKANVDEHEKAHVLSDILKITEKQKYWLQKNEIVCWKLLCDPYK